MEISKCHILHRIFCTWHLENRHDMGRDKKNLSRTAAIVCTKSSIVRAVLSPYQSSAPVRLVALEFGLPCASGPLHKMFEKMEFNRLSWSRDVHLRGSASSFEGSALHVWPILPEYYNKPDASLYVYLICKFIVLHVHRHNLAARWHVRNI